MISKIQTIFVCSSCDAQFSKWNGRCLECGGWGTLQRQTIDEKTSKQAGIAASPAAVIDFSQDKEKSKDNDLARLVTNINEVDRVLGGGIVPGSLILLSGEPGIGKSTIVAQIASALKTESPVVYVSGEESFAQVKNRLQRLGCTTGHIKFINETNVEKIIAALSEIKPALVVIDSIQTAYTAAVPSEAGSINQIRASAVQFLEVAKRNNIAFILIGHITKDGQIAGPKSLEHIVDTVIYLETETAHDYRILRATKNRFGSINELGLFTMTGSGFKEISNPSAVFIDPGEQKISGAVISCIIEGTRPFLVEAQALVSKTVFGYPQRKASGFDINRLQILTAVLTKRTKINLTNQDVILNIVGGLKINDPGIDLAICLAIASSLLNQVISRKTIVLGEVGLGGEVRQVSKLEQRLKEAEKLGFEKAMIPAKKVKEGRLRVKNITNVSELVEHLTNS